MVFKSEDVARALVYISSLSIPEQFGIEDDNCEDEVNDTERLIIQLFDAGCKKFNVFHGVSKAVIVVEDLPFVIKIPYNGMWYPDYDAGEGVYFADFIYATLNRPDDYCWREMCDAQKIKEAGFGALVPAMMDIGEYGGRRFYLQEKVIPFDDEEAPERYTSKESRNKERELSKFYNIGNPLWRAAIIEKYGEDFLEKFVSWAKTYNEGEVLIDLHERNFGFKMDGSPVIFDIGGFDD